MKAAHHVVQVLRLDRAPWLAFFALATVLALWTASLAL